MDDRSSSVFLRVLLSCPLYRCRISYGSCTLSSTLYNCNDIAVICMAHCCMVNVVICVHCMIFIPIMACLWRIGWYLVIICSQVLCVIFPYLLFLVLFFASTVFLYFLTYVLTHIALYPKWTVTVLPANQQFNQSVIESVMMKNAVQVLCGLYLVYLGKVLAIPFCSMHVLYLLHDLLYIRLSNLISYLLIICMVSRYCMRVRCTQ